MAWICATTEETSAGFVPCTASTVVTEGFANANGGPDGAVVVVVPPALGVPPAVPRAFPCERTTARTTTAAATTRPAPTAQGIHGRRGPPAAKFEVEGSNERQRLRRTAADRNARGAANRVSLPERHAGRHGQAAWPEFGSTMQEDSSTASNAEAGTDFSSSSRAFFHRRSSVPWKYQFEPLSARIRP